MLPVGALVLVPREKHGPAHEKDRLIPTPPPRLFAGHHNKPQGQRTTLLSSVRAQGLEGSAFQGSREP